MSDPKISVIVPIYNVEKYLRRCIDSILAQTYTNLEIILVDDGSPDGCPAICDEYAEKDDRIVVIHKENGGVSSARNAGLEIFNGQYVTFVDSDDFIEEKYIESLSKNINVNVGIVISSYKIFTPDLKLIEKVTEVSESIIVPINNEFDFTSRRVNHGMCSKLFKREIVINLRFSEEIFLGEDTLFCANAFKNSNAVCYINDCSYNYIQYNQSLSHGKLTLKKTTVLSAWQEIMNVFPKNTISYKSCAKEYLKVCFWVYGYSVVLQGNSNNEIIDYFYSIIKSPKTHSIYLIAPKTLKTRIKYNFLIHFRKLYDAFLLIKEPIVKHYK